MSRAAPPRSSPMVVLARVGLWLLAAALAGCTTVKPGQWLQGPSERREKRKQEAVQAFEAARAQAELQSAITAWERDDLKGCEALLQKMLARTPQHLEARLLLVDVCLATDRRDEAERHMQTALRDHPNDAQAQHAMALLLEATGRPAEALAYFERAATWEPNQEAYRLGYYAAADAARRRGATAGFAEASSGGAKLPPPPGFVPDAPGAVQPAGYPPRKSPEPVVYADRADGREGAGNDAGMTLIEQGKAALAAGQTDKAGAYFREATVVSPQNPQIPLMAAAAALRQNHPEVAITVLVPAAERFHESAAIYRALGLAHYRLGDYESSQVALRQALSLDKSSAPSYFLMGCVLAKLGQREAAEAHLRQAQALDPRCAVRR